MKILAENRFGHGAKIQPKILHKINRLLRNNVGKSEVPFNWASGVTGRLEYNIKNQYESESCWGQAFSRAVQILKNSPELSARSAYSTTFAQGGGVELRTGENGALNIGLTTEINVPSILNGDSPESFMTDVSWRTNPLIQDSLTRAGLQTINVNIDIESIAHAIRDYGCVIWVIQGQNNGTWLSQYPQPPVNKKDLWAHYMCSDSNVQPVGGNNPKFIRMYQSWGNDIGLGGMQDFGENYINSGYIVDVITFVPFQFKSNLFIGMYSNDVKQLQRRLNVPMTGFFGLMTYGAVKSFQVANNIPNTGFCGPLTRFALNK